jgi:hypothetical protein
MLSRHGWQPRNVNPSVRLPRNFAERPATGEAKAFAGQFLASWMNACAMRTADRRGGRSEASDRASDGCRDAGPESAAMHTTCARMNLPATAGLR